MRSVSGSTKPFRFTGIHMALCMIAFFSVIIAVNLFMATLASKSWTGLVVKNSYVASQKFNDKLSAAKLQQKMGWISKLAYKNGILQFSLSDKTGHALDFSDNDLFIGRPAFEQQDKVLKFNIVENGVYKLPVKLTAGQWQLQISGSVEGQPYRRDAKLFVDASGKGKIQ